MAERFHVTEQDLEELRDEDPIQLRHCDGRLLMVAAIVLARAGQATPPGAYIRQAKNWERAS